ncbi:hypothetical protein EYF80_005442 [Liparis tanakae]|uniref:Uncharacterized protein n=1 Tax=Liparis tanakae TaxID=230148 RepID=A0A4Z2J2J9_9TELE|nr:hypothetical protein EYF80_005442 [Liparis tanakae]
MVAVATGLGETVIVRVKAEGWRDGGEDESTCHPPSPELTAASAKPGVARHFVLTELDCPQDGVPAHLKLPTLPPVVAPTRLGSAPCSDSICRPHADGVSSCFLGTANIDEVETEVVEIEAKLDKHIVLHRLRTQLAPYKARHQHTLQCLIPHCRRWTLC